ncbi:MAG: TonB-dependent receptor plug domain-containing protein [Bacteroidales bacterium]|nr:TonB-dependent receptor plug domain-containing protein [Bacteroidales bacterium]
MKATISLLTLIILLFSPNAFAGSENVRTTRVFGKVESLSGTASFVNVYAKGTHHGTATSEDGFYQLQLTPGHHTLRVQGIGYQAVEREIVIAADQELEINFIIDPDIRMIEEIVISGSRVGQLRMLPGSISVIGQQEMKDRAPLSGNELLRGISGLNVVEEEGAGLRLNIGIRGLDPDKSRTVLILEDGIPVALGPYGEPEMYFTPAIERMAGLEVLKGNGQILYGPQTIGGVVNYITADPPAESSGNVLIRGGEGGFFTGQFNYGNTFGNSGILVNYLRKQADALGPTTFQLDDLSLKYKTTLNARSGLMIKMGVYDENSNSTYIGLTQAMYDEGGNDFTVLAPHDNLDVRRYSASAVHNYRITEQTKLKTILFGYTTTRNWRRQDFSGSSTASNQTGVVFGDESLSGGAIYMRNSTGNRNRQFEVAGIEPRLSSRFFIGTMQNHLDAGIRFMFERAYEQRVNGQMADAISGNLQDDEIRTGKAASAYLQNKFLVSERLAFTAGFRFESLFYERSILRLGNKDTLLGTTGNVLAAIPGAGFNFSASDQVDIFGGIHRGFAPPRIKDAISNSGEDLQLDAEKSWNMELGSRTLLAGEVELELTAFYMDFSNQVIPVSESSGGSGTGLINGGHTRHTGAELSLFANRIALAGSGYFVGFRLNATYVKSVFSSERLIIEKIAKGSAADTLFVNVEGKRTPYAPEWMLNGHAMLDSPFGLGLRISGTYTGAQFTDVLNTRNVFDFIQLSASDPDYKYMQATANGQIGEMDAFLLFDAAAYYEIGDTGLEISATVKNLFNERYIASRRPQGIRVGLPRMLMIGLGWNF